MDLSIPLGGLQKADQAFDSAASAITQSFNGNQGRQGDTAQLSDKVISLLSSKAAFKTNEKVAQVEDNLNQSTFSILA